MYFRHKHVETGSNCSHDLAIFFKHHMPLISVEKLKNVNVAKTGINLFNSLKLIKVYIHPLITFIIFQTFSKKNSSL